jgi:hypothetical protein
MLIDEHHRPANGAGRSTLCAYHAERLKATPPVVDPEVLAAELLDDINSFTTADEVNLFLGNLVRQLARKRIARRDAIALAYISQLILTSQTAMAKERESEDEAEHLGRYFLESLGRSPGASLQERPLPDNSAAACPAPGTPANPGSDQERLAS